MYILLFILCIIIILLFVNNNRYEHFYNIVPYKFRLDIAKCLTGPCAINKAYDYYKYCDNIKDTIAQQDCQIEALNISDEMFDYLKYQNYNWPLNDSNKYFKQFSLLNDNDYL